MVEDIVGCKWSLAVLGAVRSGVQRPGALEHAIEGLSKKVLNERLSKLVRLGILERQAYAEKRSKRNERKCMLRGRPNVGLESVVLFSASAAIAGVISMFEEPKVARPAERVQVLRPEVSKDQEIRLESEHLPAFSRLVVEE